MNWALIRNKLIENIIVADESFIPHISSQWDFIVRVDNLTPVPRIGWKYEDGIFSINYPAESELPRLKEEAIVKCGADMNLYIEERYITQRREVFQLLLVQATLMGKTNRVTYINTLWAWLTSIQGLFYTKRDEINEATTVQQLMSITWDYYSFDSTDPKITIEGANAIPN